MKVSLISPYPDITAFGLRTISACLRKAGHQTRMFFLPDPRGNNYLEGIEKRYPDHVLEELAGLCNDSDLIGITVMTNFFEGAVQITKSLKEKLSTPVMWGGIHPTIRPEESLGFADIVCIGEGDEAITELLEEMDQGRDYHKVKNFWFRKNGGGQVQNDIRPLNQDLDTIPAPDYSLDDSYFLYNSALCKLDKKLLQKAIAMEGVAIRKNVYQTMTSRGCPHSCTYCCNSSFRSLYKGQRYVRMRSSKHLIAELVHMKKEVGTLEYIWFSDDSFFARSLEEIKEFCALYKEKVALPFFCLGSPLTVTEEKMEALVDAGLNNIQVGIESGSGKMQALFNRKSMSNDRMLNVARIINKYRDRMLPPRYDLILDVPYETDEDKVDTLKLITNIPKPYLLQPFSLVLYPETALYITARQDGLIRDEKKEIYNKMYSKQEESYLNLLIIMSKNGNFPHLLLQALISRPVLLLFNNRLMKPINKWIFIFARKLYKLLKKLMFSR